MKIHKSTLILFLLSISGSVALSQSGPNDFDVEVAMDIMGIRQGMVIGEAGAGLGFYTFPMAERTGPSGKVYANDISSRSLSYIRNKSDSESISNVYAVEGAVADPLFPSDDLDMVVIVHAFHDFTQPAAWLENLKKYMNAETTLAILDRDPSRYGRRGNHFMSRERVVEYLTEAGFTILTIDTTLPRDNIYLCKVE